MRNYRMNKTQQQRYETLYEQHVNALKRQGKSESTIDVYSRAVRRITAYFDRCPDKLSVDDLKNILLITGRNPFLEHRQGGS